MCPSTGRRCARPDGEYSGGYRIPVARLEKETSAGRSHHHAGAEPVCSRLDGVVPAGHYFFMGDNRNDSEDSRFARWDSCPKNHLVGPMPSESGMNWRISGLAAARPIGTPIR